MKVLRVVLAVGYFLTRRVGISAAELKEVSPTATLIASDGELADSFGSAVALCGNIHQLHGKLGQ
jgi:hypothetical protein